jgi:hypothetical protein
MHGTCVAQVQDLLQLTEDKRSQVEELVRGLQHLHQQVFFVGAAWCLQVRGGVLGSALLQHAWGWQCALHGA